MTNPSMRRARVRTGIAILFIGAGLVHFAYPTVFEALVPAALREHRGPINAATGVLILALGVAFLVPRLRAAARWSAMALLVATLPVTVGRALHPAGTATPGLPPVLFAVAAVAWLAMIALIWWATKPEAGDHRP